MTRTLRFKTKNNGFCLNIFERARKAVTVCLYGIQYQIISVKFRFSNVCELILRYDTTARYANNGTICELILRYDTRKRTLHFKFEEGSFIRKHAIIIII